MEFQQLRGFYYSVRLGSLTRAADKMAITQSAISQQIKSLEEEFGIKLFNRFGPRKDLTPDGELFFRLISQLIQEIESLKVTFEDRKGTQRGLLTIAATTFMIIDILPDIIKKYTKKYSNVKLIILERRWNEIVSLAQSGEIDFGLAPVSNLPANLQIIQLEPVDRVLITSPDHPLAQKNRVTLLDIAQYPIIGYEKGLVSRDEVDRVFEEVQLNLDVVMEATNVETIKKYVELGVGIAIIPKTALVEHQNRKLKAIPVSQYFGKSQYGVIFRKGKYITSWARHFLSLLDSSLEDQMKGNLEKNL